MSACTGGTRRPGTCAEEARRSGSTTSIRRKSSPSGSAHCRSSHSRPRRPTSCSTTTTGARSAAARSPRRRRTPRCCGTYWRRRAFPSACRSQELEQRLVELGRLFEVGQVPRALEDDEAAERSLLRKRAGLLDREEEIARAEPEDERHLKRGQDSAAVGPVAQCFY